MTSLNECGDEEIAKLQTLRPSAKPLLKNIIDKEGFTSYKLNLKDISTHGGNYFGELQTVTVEGKSGDGDKKLNLFLKNIVTVDESTAPFSLTEIYKREGFAYEELFKLIEKLQDEFNIPEDDRLNVVKGYGANGDVIILEDVSIDGYKGFDRFEVTSKKIAELAIEQLGKLHAMSFVLRKEHPKFFDAKIKSMRTLVKLTDKFEAHLRRIFNIAMESLDDNAKNKFDNYFPKIRQLYQKYFDVPEEEGVCLIHGDFRANNILSKEVNGEISKVIPVDYQHIFYGRPVVDFAFFVFLSTDQQFRQKHLNDLKELYYNTFETFLSKFGVEAKGVYSRKQFEEDYREMLDYGLIAFMMLMPFIFAKIDDIPDFEDGIENITFNMDMRYEDRLRGVVDDFIQWGYL